MLPLMEMMLKSQNGKAFSQIQKQFGLNAAEAEKALEAVLPAFSTGLKRNTARPMDIGAFMQTLSGGRHAKYIDDTQAAFADDGVREGNGILGHLFGSKDVSRAVARQAAEVSGVGEGVIRQMLPVVASMVMGGLFKQSTGQTQNFGDTPSSNIGGDGILGQILGELVKGTIGNAGANRRQDRTRSRRRGRQGGNNPLGEILEQMMGGANRTSGRLGDRQANSPFGSDNPLGRIFEDMLSAKRGRYEPEEASTRRRRPKPQPEPDFYEPEEGFEDIGSAERYNRPASRTRTQKPNAPRRQAPQKPGGGLEDLFGDMFETGRDVDEGYQRGVESIFDKFMKQ